MDELEEINLNIGMIKDYWSCACYLPQMGNTPKYGDNLAWSESSAINFVNSMLGARTNRNSRGIDMLCSILGKAPAFGLMTDAGRKAKWLIEVKTSTQPNPEMIAGSDSGVCKDYDNLDLFNHDLTDKILCIPQTIGSSSAATLFLIILEKDIAPKAMLFANHIDSLAACGLLMGDNWMDKRIVTVDLLSPDFLDAVKTGDSIKILEDGTVEIQG